MKEEKLNLKSDVPAKDAFLRLLESRNYYDSIKKTSSPADITAIKGGTKHYFEIKFTRQKETYFGAATLTEWVAAIKNPGCFWFVVALEKDNKWKFIEFTPKEFMTYQTIPTFKTYFNIPLNKMKERPKKLDSNSLDKNKILRMQRLHKELTKK